MLATSNPQKSRLQEQPSSLAARRGAESQQSEKVDDKDTLGMLATSNPQKSRLQEQPSLTESKKEKNIPGPVVADINNLHYYWIMNNGRSGDGKKTLY